MNWHFLDRFREQRVLDGQGPHSDSPGLPRHVMDECVEDLAEAVVAILLSQASQSLNETQDEGSDLR